MKIRPQIAIAAFVVAMGSVASCRRDSAPVRSHVVGTALVRSMIECRENGMYTTTTTTAGGDVLVRESTSAEKALLNYRVPPVKA